MGGPQLRQCVACHAQYEAGKGYPLARGVFCSRCWRALPAPTRAAYEAGRASVKVVAALSRERLASLKTLKGSKGLKSVSGKR